ncbi:MAG: hypothetical protein ACE15C_21050 [Phycisphaerae bacterium]
MLWDEDEEQEEQLPVKAIRPMADGMIGPAKRFRDPDEQAEVERRIAIYARQVEEHGVITWLNRKGTG